MRDARMNEKRSHEKRSHERCSRPPPAVRVPSVLVDVYLSDVCLSIHPPATSRASDPWLVYQSRELRADIKWDVAALVSSAIVNGAG